MNIKNISELEGRLIYSIIVAGKSAKFTDAVMRRLFLPNSGHRPFERIRILRASGILGDTLRRSRAGNYGKLEKALNQLVDANLDLRTVTPTELEKIHGIGPKTSRFFVIWTRPAERYAALDVHVLRWMRGLGYEAPKSTPTGEKYRALEIAFIAEADKRGLSVRDLDSQIWEAGANYKDQSSQLPSQ